MQQKFLKYRRQYFSGLAASGSRLTIAYLFFALMVAVGSIPGEANALSAAFGDKLLHFCAYSFLSVLIFTGSPGRPWSRAGRTLLLIALLGTADEAIQGMMPYRTADFADWAWDMLAATWSIASLLALDAAGVQTGRDPTLR
jgi:VanZ family protein